jgi:hypothetical protein
MADNRVSNKKNVHPLFANRSDDWKLGRDSYEGEWAIKEGRTQYLPATSGMRADGFGKGSDTEGEQAYASYLMRAYYPSAYEEAVDTAVGVMHRKDPTILLTPRLERLFEVATDDGEDIYMLLRRINSQQLMTGRVGLLGTLREIEGVVQPMLIVHREDSVFNWDDSMDSEQTQDLRLAMIDESSYVMNSSFSWVWKNRTRVIALINAENKVVGFDENGELEPGVYGSALLEEGDDIASAVFEPLTAKGVTYSSIPFVFINSKDLSSMPDKPPLDSLARLALAIYRGEADYRQNLFMQGQDTLVRIGAGFEDDGDNVAVRVGAGARLDVPVNGDAKYIGVSGEGLSEQRECLKNDYTRAESKTSKLFSGSSSSESGEALKVRVASQTATLPQVAMVGAAGLQKVLRNLAEWLGDNPDDIVVTANLEFSNSVGDALTLNQLIDAKIKGVKISNESIHNYMLEQGFTELSYEEEVSLLNSEEPTL